MILTLYFAVGVRVPGREFIYGLDVNRNTLLITEKRLYNDGDMQCRADHSLAVVLWFLCTRRSVRARIYDALFCEE